MITPRLIIRLCIIGLAVLLGLAGWNKVKDDPGMMFVYFIALGVIGGILTVTCVLPWIGDAIGTVVFSSGEQITVDESGRAAAKLAQGDYEGAIAEHEKALHAKPDEVFPIGEIAKICSDKLHDPERALAFLHQHLNARQWPDDDAAFLLFRIVDIQAEALHDYDGAREHLQQVIARFPETRHAANAHHRLNEVEQAEFRRVSEQRLKSAGGGAV